MLKLRPPRRRAGPKPPSLPTLPIRRRVPPGAPPGTLLADPDAVAPEVRLIAYGPDGLEEREIAAVEELEATPGALPVTWINVDGLADLALIKALGELFGLHRLALEDVVNVHQRPKVEEYEHHAFVVTRMIQSAAAPTGEQISMFLGDRFVLTFQERAGDCFEPVCERIREHRGQIRERGADYLAYALLDAVIDSCFPVLEEYGERIEALEAAVMTAPGEHHVPEIHAVKRELLGLRRTIWPQREMLSALARDSTAYISEPTQIYLRDCYDHTVQLMDLLESYREITSSLIDVYLSSVSARMNGIMKVLTIIATIFIPLGFIAGVYGMNFDRDVSPWNMPELGWVLGYPFALALMLLTALGLLGFFYRRNWLGGRRYKGGSNAVRDSDADRPPRA